MNISQAGIGLIKGFEGFRADAYLDTGGVPTIGFGHTKFVKMGDNCTEAQAEAWLENDLKQAEADVELMVKVPLTQNQFDACVSFFYNLGAHQLEPSKTLELLNRGDYQGFADAMLKWVYDNGRKIDGLAKRRTAERALFLTA